MTTRARLPSLLIEHAITSDLDGQPWPPSGPLTGWHLVRSADGRSLWRRLAVAPVEDCSNDKDN